MKLSIRQQVNKDEKEFIEKQLEDYNVELIDDFDLENLKVIAKDVNGNIIGGLLGTTIAEWCELKVIWVHPHYRDRLIGTSLLNKAIKIAKERGCKHMFTSIFSFQNPEFYTYNHFKEVFKLEGFPKDSKKIFLTKDI
jgi:N-acetylglutamate synthase-like GNAT family acetyltransferase